jgi:predicted nucleic acid-binding Zn ribbon protein
MKRDIARELFRSYRTKVRRVENEIKNEERTGEPESLKSVMNELIAKRDWQKGLAEGNLFANWAKIVGVDVAEHAEPITLFEGRLTIRASSTAWATQLRLLSPDLLRQIQSDSSGALVEELFIIGPTAPSWKRGLRSIRGSRGPRDTYG